MDRRPAAPARERPGLEARPVEAGDGSGSGKRLQGCRAYLSIAGGFDVEPVMGGRGPCSRRASAASRAGRCGTWSAAVRAVGAQPLRPLEHRRARAAALLAGATVRVIPGAHAEEFGEALYTGRFGVCARSNRMGSASRAELARAGAETWSQRPSPPARSRCRPTAIRSVLMVDAQTLGGYPRFAHVGLGRLPPSGAAAPATAVRFSQDDGSRRSSTPSPGAGSTGSRVLPSLGLSEKVRSR